MDAFKYKRNCLNMRDEIALVPSYKIDKEKWDRCVNSCNNAMIYATTTWLDHLADNWTGIVLNDYEAVMPVPWRRKWSIRYCYQVPFVQQLGLYSAAGTADLKRFTYVMLSFCRYGSYPFNYANRPRNAEIQTNFVLALDRKYDDISMGFSNDVLQNIKRSGGAGLRYEQGEISEAIDTFSNLYGGISGVEKDVFQRLWKLCGYMKMQGNLIVRRVTDTNGKLLASALLPTDKRRLYNILNSTVPEGKKAEANYFLLSQLWKEFEESGLVFDFEGSDIPGVREFYRKFGATHQPYYRLGFNRLPWPVKIFRK